MGKNIVLNFKFINPFLPLKHLIKITSQKLLLPFYHTISDVRLPHLSNLYQVRGKSEFVKDLDYLCKHFKPISIEELTKIANSNQAIDKPVFHLTFDDGLKELYTEISPILEKKGVPATFFINTDFVDNKALFYRYKVSLLIEEINSKIDSRKKVANHFRMNEHNFNDIQNKFLSLKYKDEPTIDRIAELLEFDFTAYLKEQQPYLFKNQIKELINRGFSIGSHSLNHPLFKDIDLSEKKRQIVESFKFIEQEFDVTNLYFSFPFSDDSVERDFFDWLHSIAGCQLSFGISGLKHDYMKYHLHRIPFEQSSNKVQDIIKSEYLYYIVKSLINKNKIIRQ